MVLLLLIALAQSEQVETFGRFELGYEASYVGSERCAACHGELALEQKTHHMARTARSVTPDDALFSEDRRSAPIEWTARGVVPATPPGLEDMAAILGSGIHGVTPIDTLPGRRIRELALSYSAVQGAWFSTPGTENSDDGVGSIKTVEESQLCLSCHATTVKWRDDVMVADESALGVQCERCHGPGSAHIEAVVDASSSPAIFNPGRLEPGEEVRFCSQCHRLPTEVEPLEVLSRAPTLARHAGVGLMMSACFRRSPADDTLTCTTCHSPHRNIADEDATRFNQACTRCHQDATAVHQYERVSETSDCVSCHMPAESKGLPGLTFSDHWIRVPGAPPPIAEPSERKEALDYLEILYRNAWEDRSAGGERRARLALGLAEVLFGLERRDDAYAWVRESLAHPHKTQQSLKAAAMFREGGELDQAEEILAAEVKRDPGLVRAHFDLGELSRQRRAYDDALVHYQRALELRPDFGEALVSSAAVVRQLGRTPEALELYRQAETLEPGDPVVLEGIAWSLATAPEQAVRDPAEAVRLGERLAAETRYRHPIILDTLAAAYAAAGDFEEAMGAARRAIEIATQSGATELATTIARRLALYEKNTPYTATPR